METRTWTLFFATPNIQTTCNITRCCWSSSIINGKGPSYCHMTGRGLNCCLLGHVTGLLFCLYVKIILPSFFNLIDIWINISLIVLDVELTEKNIIKDLGLFLLFLYKDIHFVRQKLLSPINRQHGTQVIYMELSEVVEKWIMISSLLCFTT